METIKIFDAQNYQPHWKKYKRDSVRGIIFHAGRLVLVRSDKYGEYKFPGGGIEAGESHADALAREVREETGLHVIPESVAAYGKTLVLRKGRGRNTQPDEIFEQESFYYTCEIDGRNRSQPQLDPGYEQEYGYRPVFATLEEAIKANEERLHIPEIPWVARDLYVLEKLLREG
ncbi:MAG: NUDIX domain-containing protein [Defluviitaleaceae bacterium]|nr:NUDIX domain-containing protein [Defluviitaleaceae bacterium]MCL2204299.1 NUDIX domain-containing protein [Defluviitaleaceae bacterium]MCL2240525.1 NUDIX domain-containing protein [Defluviitaleaceae bacterium]